MSSHPRTTNYWVDLPDLNGQDPADLLPGCGDTLLSRRAGPDCGRGPSFATPRPTPIAW